MENQIEFFFETLVPGISFKIVFEMLKLCDSRGTSRRQLQKPQNGHYYRIAITLKKAFSTSLNSIFIDHRGEFGKNIVFYGFLIRSTNSEIVHYKIATNEIR